MKVLDEIAAAPLRRRRGELAPALIAYEKAERYAPAGKSKHKRIEELRRRLVLPPLR